MAARILDNKHMSDVHRHVNKPWQTGRSVVECLRYKFEKQLHCDVWFTVNKPEPTKIGAHKFMLMTRSPVFETMFADLNQSPHITIDDIKVQIFNQLLKYIYTDNVDLQAENVLDLYCTAQRYGLDELATRTKDYLARNLDNRNIWLFLERSTQLDNCIMKQVCIDFIARNISGVLKKEEFFNLSQDLLLKILKRDELCIELETHIYFACVSWAKKNVPEGREPTDSELRQILGPCLYNIRFAAMTADQLAETGGSSGLLSDNEKLALFCYISNHGKQTELKAAGFNILPRYLQNTCNLFDLSNPVSISTMPARITRNELQFSVDKGINIHGINVLSCGKSGSYDVTVSFFTATSRPVTQQLTTQSMLITSPYVSMKLDRVISLKPGGKLDITVDPNIFGGRVNCPKYRVTNPRSTVQAQNVKFTITKNQNNFITSIVFDRS